MGVVILLPELKSTNTRNIYSIDNWHVPLSCNQFEVYICYAVIRNKYCYQKLTITKIILIIVSNLIRYWGTAYLFDKD